jgi:hypothetical protein
MQQRYSTRMYFSPFGHVYKCTYLPLRRFWVPILDIHSRPTNSGGLGLQSFPRVSQLSQLHTRRASVPILYANLIHVAPRLENIG